MSFPSIPEVETIGSRGNIPNGRGRIAGSSHNESTQWKRISKTLFRALWQRRPRWDVESMYQRDPRDCPSPNPLKPTSLSGKLVADIWLLNSKL